MAEPWFDPNEFGTWFGAIGGGVGGTLAGLLGAAIGTLLPMGKGRGFILAAMALFLILGIVMLGVGVYALIEGQPYGIWYGLVLLGGMFTFLFGVGLPMVRAGYQMVEQRKLDAEALRRA